MKSLIQTILTTIFLIIFSQAHAQLLKVKIMGPTSCVLPATDITYTGSHDFCSSGCTEYIWTVTDGQFVVNGSPITCGTIKQTEAGCFIIDPCVNSAPIPGCGNVPVVVRWNPGVSTGKLKLQVKEVGTITLAQTKEITVQLMGRIDNVSQTAFSCSSATFTATTSFSQCPGAPVIHWFEQVGSNFVFRGTGTSLTTGSNFDNRVYRLELRNAQGAVLHTLTRNFPGKKPQTLTGPVCSCISVGNPITLNLNQQATTANWSVFSGCTTFNGTTSFIDLFTTCQYGSGFSVNVSGTWECGTFSAYKWINIDPTWFGNNGNEEYVEELENSNVDERAAMGKQVQCSTLPGLDVELFPVPVTGHQISGNLRGNTENASIKIMNMNGQTIIENFSPGNTFSIELPEMSDGFYLMQVSDRDQTITKKFLVNQQ